MSDRICEVQAIPIAESQRWTEFDQFGHYRHECLLTRPFAQEHAGPHRCECGMEWSHQESDNDPPLWLREEAR